MGEKEEEFSSEIKTMAVHFTRLDSPSPRKTSKNSGHVPFSPEEPIYTVSLTERFVMAI